MNVNLKNTSIAEKLMILTPSLKFISSIWREINYAVIHFLLPHFCLTCTTTNIESNEIICENCWKSLPVAPSSEKIMMGFSRLLGECHFTGAISVWQFSREAQTIIHYLKYRAFGKLAQRIGKAMAEKLSNEQFLPQNILLIPIPLHNTRKRERGYNQSSLLCQAISSETGIPFDECVLSRVRCTASQTKLNAKKRQKNVENAFAVLNREKILNKTIILVDDVITTGATMNSCAGELLMNGAKKIYILSAVKA